MMQENNMALNVLLAPLNSGEVVTLSRSSRGFGTIYIPVGIFGGAISDLGVIIIGKMGKVPEYQQRPS